MAEKTSQLAIKFKRTREFDLIQRHCQTRAQSSQGTERISNQGNHQVVSPTDMLI